MNPTGEQDDGDHGPEEGQQEERGRPRSVRSTLDRAAVDEWLLVLTAEGFRASVHHTGTVFVIQVPAAERDAAGRVLEQYDAENVAPDRPRPLPPERITDVDRFTAGALALAMIAFFVWTGPRNQEVVWFAQGSADAAAILAGDLWRTVTALCLHADWAHVLSNAVFGALFVAAAAAGYGPGVALLLTVAAGAGGNLANAIFQGPGHASVGASTAVFAAVGLLGGRGVAQRLRRGELGFRLWIPLSAGLAIIAMVGTGERTDIWAHLFGFLTGGFLGIPASLAWPRRASPLVQSVCAIAGIGILLEAWRLVLT